MGVFTFAELWTSRQLPQEQSSLKDVSGRLFQSNGDLSKVGRIILEKAIGLDHVYSLEVHNDRVTDLFTVFKLGNHIWVLE